MLLNYLRPVLILALFLCCASATAASRMSLDQGWEYRWGDSPFVDGVPQWVLADEPEHWHDIAFPSNPPGRHLQQNVWYRVALPQSNWVDPVLYVTSIDLIAEVYLGANKIYHYGEFDAQGKGDFIGWPWHMIELSPENLGQTLYFRVYSDYTDIGLWGEVMLMERPDLLLMVISNSVVDLAIAAFCIFIALLALAFVPMRPGSRHFVYLALFSLAIAGKLLGENAAVQLVLDAPLFRVYLTAASYFSMPIFIAFLLGQWLGKEGSRLINRIGHLHLAYLLVALGLSLIGVIHLSITYPIFDALFTLTLVVLLVLTLRDLKQLNADQRLIVTAFSIFALFLLVDMAVAHGFLPWTRVPLSLGGLIFILALVLISLREYGQTQKAVRLMNATLETRVAERTAAIQTYAQIERERTQQAERNHLLSLRLDELVNQLQQLDSLNEAGVLLAQRLPEVFEPTLLKVKLLSQEERYAEEELSECEVFIIVHQVQSDHPFAKVYLDLTSLASDDARAMTRAFLVRMSERIGVTLTGINLRESLQQMSYEDALTGLKNRRFLDDSLKREIALAKRQQSALSILICDIDFFKQFNDRFGHQAGDMALRAVASVMLEQFRETDVCCRFGGEEFVVVMPGIASDSALQRAQDLLRKVSERELVYQGQHLGHITVSIGIATWPNGSSTPYQLMDDADRALYRAKQNGRNRVEVQQIEHA
ncbi:GGDEF domain-containing protein [Nitrincola alkalilacustris]|uniref:GGDEF domain-containing protein n=1 Tax=Nitrincola alkalilacustris TaxID=1571224 RepID=UPI00124EB843|nr:GGDEF domain-containing protein [Nitrincola alkalilacustris]